MYPYVGEIRLFSGTFAPAGWSFCDGSLQLIAQYEALYTLIGTSYGGNGVRTFGLPDLRGRVVIGQGAGPGLTPRAIAATGGVSAVVLGVENLPVHSHTVTVSNQEGISPRFLKSGSGDPVLTNMATISGGTVAAYTDKTKALNSPVQMLAEGTIDSSGEGKGHSNLMPGLGLHYIIATTGIFPSHP